MDSQSPNGSIIFSTVGRTDYGFDIFALKSPLSSLNSPMTEHRLTDGASVNFNGHFINEDQTLVFVSERSGAPRIYLRRPRPSLIKLIPISVNSLFLDRPIFRNDRLYYISSHQHPKKSFISSSALYSTTIDGGNEITRLTPNGHVDYSPAISKSGHMIAVASYGDRRWPSDEFHDLSTDIVVFPVSKLDMRMIGCRHGGWPAWSGDSTIYFHRKADDGWWSIFKIDLPDDLSSLVDDSDNSIRVTPPGVHCFTPAAPVSDTSKSVIAVATRRPGRSYRHIEIFDLKRLKFFPVTELINPNTHHYNPFFSPESTYLGYHRYRGESYSSETTIPPLDPVISPESGLIMMRLNGFFPTSSPSGDFIAFNPGLSGLEIVKSDGSKKWTLIKDRASFGNSWSPAEPDVIFTSIGPIFESVNATVQIARVSFNSFNFDNSDDSMEIPVDIKILTGEETGNNAFPSCSPDGKQVVFRSGRSGYKNLYIIDALNGEMEGGEIRQLTNGAWIDTMPSWSPDGKLIAFSSNRHNPNNIDCFSIYVVHPDGSGLRRIHVAGPEGSEEVDKERLNHVCFSKDSEWLLFTGNLSGVTAEPVSLPNQFQPYGDLYLVKLDGSGLRRLTCNGYENGTPAWHTSTMPLTITGETKQSGLVGDKLRGEFDDVLWMKC